MANPAHIADHVRGPRRRRWLQQKPVPACRRRTVQELRPTGLIQNGRARPLVATETKATAPRAMISPAAPINLIIGELATWPNEAQKPER